MTDQVLLDVLALARSGNAQAREALDEFNRARQNLQGRAATVDKVARTVDVVASTETPVEMYSMEQDTYIPEVLLASGFQLPAGTKSVPLLDTHNRWSTSDLLGSAENWRTENDKVVCTVRFSTTQAGSDALILASEGHLTDVSVGYRVTERTFVPAGSASTIGGKTFKGPVTIATKWTVRELSACPIGADPLAKLRSVLPQNPTHSTTPAARANGQSQQEGSSMDPVTQSPGTPPAVPTTPSDPGRSEPTARVINLTEEQRAEERAKGVKAEAERRAAITELGEMTEATPELIRSFVGDPTKSYDEARKAFKAEFDKRKATPQTTVTGGLDISAGPDKGLESEREALADSFVVRSGLLPMRGLEKKGTAEMVKPHERTREFMSTGLHGAMRTLLIRHGVSPSRVVSLDGDNLIKAVRSAPLAAADLSGLFANVLNKSIRITWGLQNTNWRKIANTMTLKDLRQHRLYADGGYGLLHEIGDTAEVPQENRGDGTYEVITGKTYAKIVSVSYEAMVNDDMGVLVRDAAQVGNMTDQTIEHLVFYTLLQGSNNVGPTMTEDNTACFTSGHGNLETTGAAPSATTLNAALKAMRKQTRPTSGNTPDAALVPLNLEPKILLVPAALEGTAWALLNSISNPGDNNVNSRNMWYNRLSLVVSPLLDLGATVYRKSGKVTSTAVTAGWYVMTDPNQFEHLVLGLLNGSEAPEFAYDSPLEVLCDRFRVRLGMDAGISNFRGLYYNDGA